MLVFGVTKVGQAGGNSVMFSLIFFPFQLTTAGTVPVEFVLTPVGRGAWNIVVSGEHLAIDAFTF